MTDFDPAYIVAVVGGRTSVDWFTPTATSAGAIAGPADVYLTTVDGTVTWGWAVAPIPIDGGGRRFRRFDHPDGWVMLTDADDPEQIFLPASLDVHTVTGGPTDVALAVPAGTVPGPGDAYTLHKAAAHGAAYRLDQGWEPEAVSAALRLWLAVFAEHEVPFEWRSATDEETQAIERLLGEPEPVLVDDGPLGRDDELAEVLAGVDDVFWMQGELTWPDRADREAFRDRIDVRVRDRDGTDTWLVSVEPLPRSGSRRILPSGGVILLDPEDPTVLGLEWDRLVLAVSRHGTGHEPAGVAVPSGEAPGPDQWDELRRVLGGETAAVLTHAPAWSEERVAEALTTWAAAWAGTAPAFVYDFDDPVAQAGIEANDALGDAEPESPSVRTATRQVCGHSDDPSSPYEVPLACGRPATAYYRDGEAVRLVCDEHVPDGVRLTTLLRA